MNNNEIALNIIKKSKKSLTAYEILDRFQEIKKVQPMTVYRSLNHLINKGFIHKANHNKSYLLCNHYHKEKHNTSKKGIAKAYLELSRLFFVWRREKKHYHIAIKYGEKAAKAYKKASAPEGESSAYIMIGNTYGILLKEYEKCEINLKKSVNILKKTKNFDKIVMAYLNIGGLYADTRKHDLAKQYISKAYKINKLNKKKNQTYNNFTIMRSEAMNYQSMGDYVTALKTMSKSLRIMEEEYKNESFHFIKVNLYSIARYNYLIGDYKNTLKVLNRLLEMNKKEMDNSSIYLTLFQMGKVYENLRFYNKSFHDIILLNFVCVYFLIYFLIAIS